MVIVKCSNCGREVKKYPSQVKPLMFCNKSCHRAYKNKLDNPSKHRDLSGENNPMWGKHTVAWNKGMTGEKWVGWKGGHYRKDGYKVIKIAGKKILEHRYLLRDKLKDGNVVHHKDRNPSNNSLDNLEILVNQAEHARLHKNVY